MNDFEIVAGVFAAVFILGIGMGVIVVIAMSRLRQRRNHRGYGNWWKPPPGDDDVRQPPRWPGG